jgi:hypothetical protein
MNESLMAMLIIGQLMHSPIGVVFKPMDRVKFETLSACWSAATLITQDPRTSQVAMCAPFLKDQKDAHR